MAQSRYRTNTTAGCQPDRARCEAVRTLEYLLASDDGLMNGGSFASSADVGSRSLLYKSILAFAASVRILVYSFPVLDTGDSSMAAR